MSKVTDSFFSTHRPLARLLKTGFILLSGATMTSMVMSANLGAVRVLSSVGQPLRAEIDIDNINSDTRDLNAEIASSEAFRIVNMNRQSWLNQVKLTVKNRTTTTATIQLTTATPVQTTDVDVLVALSWQLGSKIQRQTKGYTLALNPPTKSTVDDTQNKPNSTLEKPDNTSSTNGIRIDSPLFSQPANQTAAQAESTTQATSTQPDNKNANLSSPARSLESFKAKLKSSSSSTQGQVKTNTAQRTIKVTTGNTLIGIANQLGGNAPLPTKVAALVSANPTAFIGGNANRMKAGAILKVPQTQRIQQLSNTTVQKVLQVSQLDWLQRQHRLAKQVTQQPTSKRPSISSTARGQISTQVTQHTTAQHDHLRLARQSKKNVSTPQQAIEKQAIQADEQIAQNKALEEAQKRISNLEQTVSDLQKLLELKNQALASAQLNAESKKAPSATESPKAIEPAAPAKIDPPAPEKAVKPTEEDPLFGQEKPVPAATNQTPTPITPATIETHKPWGLIAGLMGGLMLLLGGGGGFVWWRARQKSSVTDTKSSEVTPTPSIAVVATSDAAQGMAELIAEQHAEASAMEPPVLKQTVPLVPTPIPEDDVMLDMPIGDHMSNQTLIQMGLSDEEMQLAQEDNQAIANNLAAEKDNSNTLDATFENYMDVVTPPSNTPSPGPEIELDFTGIDLNLGESSADHSDNPKWQEMATKLDLAKAYLDIGDRVGAQELLDEVIQFGDTLQINKAKELRAAL
jgi:pilus assembly protein FimV